MCEPPKEEEETEGGGTMIRGTSSTSGTRGRKPPELKRTIGGQDTAEARALGFANGGSVGLNQTADKFLRALQGAA